MWPFNCVFFVSKWSVWLKIINNCKKNNFLYIKEGGLLFEYLLKLLLNIELQYICIFLLRITSKLRVTFYHNKINFMQYTRADSMVYLKCTIRNYMLSCNNFKHIAYFLWNKHLTFCSVMRFTQVLLYKNNDTDIKLQYSIFIQNI